MRRLAAPLALLVLAGTAAGSQDARPFAWRAATPESQGMSGERLEARVLNAQLDPNGVRREILVHPRSGLGVLWQMIEWKESIRGDREARRAALRDGEVYIPGISE